MLHKHRSWDTENKASGCCWGRNRPAAPPGSELSLCRGGKPTRDRTHECSAPSRAPGPLPCRGGSQPSGRAVLTPRQLSRKVTLHKPQSREHSVPTSPSWESVPSQSIHRVIQTTEIISGANNPHVAPAPAADPHTVRLGAHPSPTSSLVPGAGLTNYSLPAPPAPVQVILSYSLAAHTCKGNSELQPPCTHLYR